MKTTVEKILLDYDPEKKNLLPALREISAAFGYVSVGEAEKVADYFSLPLAKVYESASFYDRINIKKQPQIVIQVCGSINCATNDSFRIIREIENYYHIKTGDDHNPKTRLEIISCLERCGEGPIMVVNDKVYTRVTVSGLHTILEEWL